MGEKWRLLVQVWLMKNRALYLKVNVLRKKVPSRDIIFTRGRHFKNQQRSIRLQGEESSFISELF